MRNIRELIESNYTPEDITFYELIEDQCERNPHNIAFSYENVDYTYADLRNSIDDFALMLIERGVKPADHVALWSYNSYSWVVAFMGIIRAGAVAVLVNYSLPLSDVVALTAYTDVKYVVYGNNRDVNKGLDFASALTEGLKLNDNSLISVDSIDYAPGKSPASDKVNVKDDSHRTAVMMFTSGTSADPKAVMLSQYSMVNVAIAQTYMLGSNSGEVAMAALPLFHSFGIQTMFTYLALGRRQVIISAIKPQNVLDLIDKYKITDLYTVASVYLALIDLPSFHQKVEPVVKLCVIGGALANASHMMRLDQAFSQAFFANGYGQTEASPGITLTRVNDPFEKKINTVGKPFPFVEVKIMNPKKEILAENEQGEIVVKGYNLMNGYYKLSSDRQAIDEQGWLHTGDLGMFDEDGYLHFNGRIKDIIIKNGENIAPKEVEESILEYENIVDAKVFGAPHPIWGESIEACICVKEGTSYDEEKIKEYLKGILAPYKVPSNFFVFESFPLNTNGKINQRQLKEEMLLRLRKRNIRNGLEKGICTFSTVVSALPYSIEMISHTLEAIAENLDYESRRVKRVSRAATAWMRERIYYAEQFVDTIEVSVIFFNDRLRISFRDKGNFINVSKLKDKNPNLIIVEDSTDSFFAISEPKKSPVYCMEFRYDDGFDIKKYLLHYGSNGTGITWDLK